MFRVTVCFNDQNKSFLEDNPFKDIEGTKLAETFGSGNHIMIMQVDDFALGKVEQIVKDHPAVTVRSILNVNDLQLT